MSVSASFTLKKETAKDVFEMSLYKKSNPKRQKIYFISASLIIWIFLSIYFSTNGGKYLFPFVFLMIFSTVYIVFLLFIFPYVTVKKMKPMFGRMNNYTFRENDFDIDENSDGIVSHSTISYSTISSILESDKYILFIMPNKIVYPIEKITINYNDIEILSNRLKNIGIKYIRCKY